MAEPVDVAGLPVALTPGRQKRWDTGDEAEREKVRAEIVALRRKDDPQSGTWDRPTSFDDVTRQHGEP
jgi:hypothetical protein